MEVSVYRSHELTFLLLSPGSSKMLPSSMYAASLQDVVHSTMKGFSGVVSNIEFYVDVLLLLLLLLCVN